MGNLGWDINLASCVCVCVCACARACVRVCACVCVCVLGMCVRARALYIIFERACARAYKHIVLF